MSLSDADMIEFREAIADDLAAIVAMFRDESSEASIDATQSMERYRRAFDAIGVDASQRLIVGVFHRHPVCCGQLSIRRGLSNGGAMSAQIDGLCVAPHMRGRGIAIVLVGHLVAESRRAGVQIVRLTTHNKGDDSLRFYERLGFEPGPLVMEQRL